MAHSFTKEELQRYNRQMMLPEIGLKGQEKIKAARVLVVGAGGLGCPTLLYLAGAGVGHIGIVDFDKIEVHNLHRQILYDTADIGQPKAQVATDKLKQKNPHLTVTAYNTLLDEKNAEIIISRYDIVVDGSDNFLTRYLVNDVCVTLNKPLVYGTILKAEGQLAVFNLNGSKHLRDLYQESPNPEDVPGCDENGVMGYVPGIIGAYMSNLTIQVILNTCQLQNKLLLADLQSLTMQTIHF